MIELYEHNRTAYGAAVSMMKQTGRAAVVHPTGTGKSFIGFKLCEDFPEKTVCWLSPSEYIFRTQLENLRAAGGEEPRNIRFLTYARLVQMGREEMEGIGPDMFVLDEFHRAGAAQWGISVRDLLELYPDAPVLGLSATNIRYLDDQRDMAEELFGGNIASSMTLGEAIARGILGMPRYITGVYFYRKELERLSQRAAKIRDGKRRDRAEKYLEELKRALEMADGMDALFDKHMTDRTGKYIVFCADKEHMDRMMEEGGDWFAKVDRHPHIYSVYSEDPQAQQSFADFKEDKDDKHLRLLYCIDALNEGIHVGDISGVILLRPTVSPIIYKQQIGRALSAGETREPAIFDIVDNIAGLYSIDSLKDEMEEAVRYYQSHGEGDRIVNDRFYVTDTVRDCRKLFDKLEETLSASWETMYAEARRYFEGHGDLLPNQSYVTEEGIRLGQWVVTQRVNYRGGVLSPERIDKLEQIGMRWETMHERQWAEGYALAEAYHAEHGDLGFTTDMTPRLQHWLIRQRQKQREGALMEEQFRKLSALGMVWEFDDSWEQKYELAREYFEMHGHLDIPVNYSTKDSIPLGAWYRTMRNQYRDGTLSVERQRKLEAIGFQKETIRARGWMQYYHLAKRYYEEHGDLNIRTDYETPEGVKLGVWISSQRFGLKKGRVTEEQKHLLDTIGMEWDRFAGKWEAAYREAKRYCEEHGMLDPPVGYRTAEGFALGAWIASQRTKYRTGKLSQSRIRRLEELHIVWNIRSAKAERQSG